MTRPKFDSRCRLKICYILYMPKKKSAKRSSHVHARKTPFHRLLVFTAILAVTWGVWTLFDQFLGNPNPMAGALVAILFGIAFLVWDDFRLKELE